jgi:hypothetical protein
MPEHDPFPLTCKHCGAQEEGRYIAEARREMAQNQACHNCNFWLEKVRWREQGNSKAVVTETFKHYLIGSESVDASDCGFRGFGGRKFTVLFNDGRRVDTRNLWHQGTVPERFRDRLTPNAEVL